MLRMLGKPLVRYSLENAVQAGVSEIVVVVGYRAEEIINDLTHVDGLRVASRTSAFAFKNQAQDIRGIGSKLGVDLGHAGARTLQRAQVDPPEPVEGLALSRRLHQSLVGMLTVEIDEVSGRGRQAGDGRRSAVHIGP